MSRSCALAIAVLLAIVATGCSSGGCFWCASSDVAEAPMERMEPDVAFTPPAETPPVATAPPARVIVLRGVNFGFDSSTIRDEDRAILEAAVESLKENPGVRVEVAGFTDSTGPEAHNMTLSEQRAEAVAQFFTQAGIDESRLVPVGHGVNNPVASNSTRDGRAQNRRVELSIRE